MSGIPENTNTVIVNTDEHGDEIFLDSSGFDTPSRLLYGTAGGSAEEIERAPSFFDAADLEVSQHFATSDDGTAIPYFVVSHRHSGGARADAARRLRRFRGGADAGLRRRAGPAVAGAWGYLCDGQHPRRRRVRADMAHPGDARRQASGRRGLRRCGKGSGAPRYHDGRAARCAGRKQRRPADGHHADAVPGAVRRAGVQRATAGHAAVPPVAGGRVVGCRVRRPGQPRRLGVHLQILPVSECFGGPAVPAGADHHLNA